MGRHSQSHNPTSVEKQSAANKKSEFLNSTKEKIKILAEKLNKLPQEQRSKFRGVDAVISALELRSSQSSHETTIGNSSGTGTPAPAVPSPNPSPVTPVSCPASKLNYALSFLSTYFRKCLYAFLSKKPSKSNMYCVFFSVLALVFYMELHTSSGFTRFWLKWDNVDLRSVECTIESPNLAMELFRPPVPCVFCHNVKSADRVNNITPEEFEHRYAYSGRPVIITDAMANWTATSTFTFSFLKSIYGVGSRSLEHLGEDCLFFPYSTEFRSLAEVFNMSHERSLQPWYIGWSNCDAATSFILRKHYERPYFLPTTAESTHADWLFMGNPGYGAHMHIDHVINPSWQAQITGRKRWFLQPPPECFYQCNSFHIDVEPGEIIVLDTNKWYHQTKILPGDMSITIGSEYD